MNTTTDGVLKFKKASRWKEVWRRLKKDRVAMIGLIIISIIVFFSIAADFITPYSMVKKQDYSAMYAPPSAQHWFGTDDYGRDLFARCLHGSRISLLIGFATAIVTLLGGALIGSFVGYVGGRLDNLIMRALDVFSSIPDTLFAMAIVAAMGPGIINICVAISLTNLPTFVRVVRASVLNIVEQEFIEAARAGGASTLYIMIRHILPNTVGILIVQTTANIASTILLAATLSFLGLGINPPAAEWGALVSAGKEFLRTQPLLILIPGLLICITSFAISVLGDGLRDALDPRLRT